MKTGEVRRLLRAQCDGKLQSHGYIFVSTRDAYQRNFGEGVQIVHCRLVSQAGAVVMALSASICFVEMKRRLHGILGLRGRDADLMSTIWAMANVLRGRPKTELDLRIRSEDDVDVAAADVVEFATNAAVKFFSSFPTVGHVERVLNETPDRPCPYQTEPRRSEYGIIAATLVGRTDIRDLVEVHRAVLTRIDRGIHLEEYDVVAEAALAGYE